MDEESSEESEEEVRSLSTMRNPVLSIYCVQVEEFYSPGSLELLEARRLLAEYSLPRLDFR